MVGPYSGMVYRILVMFPPLEKDRKESILNERVKMQNGKHFDGELWDRYRQIDQDVYFDIMAFRSKLIEASSGNFDYDALTKYDNQFSK